NLAQLAANGQYFENAWSLIPITLPSHSAMFYSMPPHQLKVYNNGQDRKIPQPTVTQLLKGKGYATGAVISLGVLKGEFGLNKGFDRYIENFQPNLWTKDAAEVNRDALELIEEALKKQHKEPFFSWLHYSDPHEPYFPAHNPDTGRFRIFLGDQEVFLSYCTAYPTVDIKIEVKPGTHRLTFDSEIPPHFRKFKGFKLEYIKYRDFSLKPLETPNPDSSTADSPVKIKVPEDWNTKEEKGTVNYYSKNFRSDITLENTSRETVSMQLRMIYYSHPDRHTRKMFYREEVRYMDQKLGELIAF
ncbi:MAG: sulfatase-like hydrolase/transferase, partial [bacterium]|nr:sulfatase-like hydrolase/transferase [bacterium]